MAARSIWRGSAPCARPVPCRALQRRHDRAGIRFNLINPDTGNKDQMIAQDAETGQELERRNLVKGYEFRKNQYVLLSDEDSTASQDSSVTRRDRTAGTHDCPAAHGRRTDGSRPL
jgi:DNA end-binding protein Ku